MQELSSERWRRLSAILDEVFELPSAARAPRVSVLCEGDESLQREVDALLRADSDAGAFLETPAPELAAHLLARPEVPGAAAVGERLGPYQVVRELGRGGMGAVYLAERADGGFEQQVAVKVIRRGMDSQEILRRFLFERQILARLRHPHIARLLDGGVTTAQQPYFAMEYVDGLPITEYCDANRLTVAERVRLFLAVCDAVGYAHRNLVVHRDLKPSNILVTADGRPILLDFGIAKVLGPAEADAATLTSAGMRMLTPEYAAPEQVTGEAITTATDVYALGSVLYELVSGHRPHRFARISPLEVERVICREQPEAPSVVATRDSPATDEISRTRSTDPGHLRRSLSGDLDTVILRAMHKEPERRYSSAEAFAEDLDRHLAGLPVRARQDSLRYRASRFVRRHRAGVAAAGFIALALLAGLVGTLWQARVADRRADLARAEAAKADAVRRFLVSLFEGASPAVARGRDISARELLDIGVRRVDSAALTAHPEIRAEILFTLALIHRDLGLYARTDSLLQRAEAIQRDLFGEDDPRLATTQRARGRMRLELGDHAGADSLLKRALAIHRRRLDPTDTVLVATLYETSGLERRRGNFAAAESLMTEALAIDSALYGMDHLEVATDLSSLAVIVSGAGDASRAVPLQRRALAIRRRHLSSPDPAIATALANLGAELTSIGEYAEAERMHREALAMRRALFAGPHPEVAYSLNGLAQVLVAQGRLEEAAPLYKEALEVRRAMFGPEHPEYIASLNNFGTFSYRLGDLASAAAAFRESLASWRRSLGPTHPSTMTAMTNLGTVLRDSGALTQAEPLLLESLRLRRRIRGPRHAEVAVSLRHLGVLRHRQGRLAAAIPLLVDALGVFRDALPERHPRIAEGGLALGAALTASGRAREAEPVLREALAIRIERLGENDTRTAIARRELGACLTALGRYAEADTLLVAASRVIAVDRAAWRERAETERRLRELRARSGPSRSPAGGRSA
jgi:serine/threonine-protein kinase